MLLITKANCKNKRDYPTMFMIIPELFEDLLVVLFYFQYDRLWKSVEVASTVARSHDVYDEKGVSPELAKPVPFFSITYRQQSETTFGAFELQSHDLHDRKGVRSQSALSGKFVCY
jgi:hypothetical protein